MSEASITKRITTLLDKRGAWWMKKHGSGWGRAGIPDIIACVPPGGAFLAIEVKAPTGRPTPLQERELELIRRAGGTAIVARGPDDVAVALDALGAQDDGLGVAA